MKSYVSVTFVFLAVAFYQLSGGADYAPRGGSVQAEAAKARVNPAQRVAEAPRAAPRSQTVLVKATEPAAEVTRAALTVDLTNRPQITDAVPAPETAADTRAARIESYSLARLSPAPLAGTLHTTKAEPLPEKDIRSVLKPRVNMRMGPGTQYNVVAKLDAGTPVYLLENPGDGWVKLREVDTGRVGWMATSLISAAN